MKLLHGDCLELMKDIPDGSVDMILCDLPYGTTACKWDSVYGKKKNPSVQQYTGYPHHLLEFRKDARQLHPTQKPVALLEYLIRTYTVPGETVLDNCMGSGSTGVACVNTGRDFIGIELERKYYEIAAGRIAAAQRQDAA